MGNFETDINIQGEFSPFERVILTANGNLQRIMSAYYGAPVHVKINKCVQVESQVFDREVDLYVGDFTFCRAIGKVYPSFLVLLKFNEFSDRSPLG